MKTIYRLAPLLLLGTSLAACATAREGAPAASAFPAPSSGPAIAPLAYRSRTLASFAGAIVGAEYLLGWLPRGTHSWRAFLTPAELARHLRRVGLRPVDVAGVSYRADRDEFRLSRDTGVNYMLTALKG